MYTIVHMMLYMLCCALCSNALNDRPSTFFKQLYLCIDKNINVNSSEFVIIRSEENANGFNVPPTSTFVILAIAKSNAQINGRVSSTHSCANAYSLYINLHIRQYSHFEPNKFATQIRIKCADRSRLLDSSIDVVEREFRNK